MGLGVDGRGGGSGATVGTIVGATATPAVGSVFGAAMGVGNLSVGGPANGTWCYIHSRRFCLLMKWTHAVHVSENRLVVEARTGALRIAPGIIVEDGRQRCFSFVPSLRQGSRVRTQIAVLQLHFLCDKVVVIVGFEIALGGLAHLGSPPPARPASE